MTGLPGIYVQQFKTTLATMLAYRASLIIWMIGQVLDLPSDERLEGTAATVALGIANGADMIRVHDVLQMKRVARMADAVVRGKK